MNFSQKRPIWLQFRKRLITLLALVIVGGTGIVAGMGMTTVHAQSTQRQQASSTSGCIAGNVNDGVVFCIQPSLDITCGGPVGTATDGLGNPIQWTFQGDVVCDTISYDLSPLFDKGFTRCNYSFYVPDGDATGTITFQFTAPNATKTNIPLNEGPVDDFQTIGEEFNPVFASMFFTDNIGLPSSTQIGWGTSLAHSLAVFCEF